MYLQVVKNIMVSRNLKQTDIAKMAHVSRAAVTKWFKSSQGFCNVETMTLLNLAEGLNISPDILLTKTADVSQLKTKFLWDHLYPSMESFMVALIHRRFPAIARLVQVVGFKDAQTIIGHESIKLFPKYKKFIKPARLKELEVLWPIYH